MADQPTTVRVEMAPETLQRLAELMPAVGLWGKSRGRRTGDGAGRRDRAFDRPHAFHGIRARPRHARRGWGGGADGAVIPGIIYRA